MMDLAEYERIQPTTVAEEIRWYVPNTHIVWRIETLLTKEPDTIAWIRGMTPDEVFYDVGANIGQYTLIAAKQGLKVFAFEPESQNFAVLTKNLALNMPMTNNAVAFPICISDEAKLDTLRLSMLMAGGSCHSFASDMNYKRQEKQWAYRQGTMGLRLDGLVFECGLPQPDHIKVDVDGFEDKVVKGGLQVLEHTKSVLLELDSANSDHMRARDMLLEMGFVTDEAQILAARRKEGAFEGIGNVIFKRTQAPEVVQPQGEENSISDFM